MNSYGVRAVMDAHVKGQAEDVVQRLYLAVKYLCIAKGDVRSRVKGAVEELIFLREESFPEHLKEDFIWIKTQASRYAQKDYEQGGKIEATMRRIKNSTGAEIAERIFKLYADVQNIRGFPLLEYRQAED